MLDLKKLIQITEEYRDALEDVWAESGFFKNDVLRINAFLKELKEKLKDEQSKRNNATS